MSKLPAGTPLVAIIVAILLVMSVSVYPALAASSENEPIASLNDDINNQISAITLNEVSLNDDLHAATMSQSTGSSGGVFDTGVVDFDDGTTKIHVVDPLSDLRPASPRQYQSPMTETAMAGAGELLVGESADPLFDGPAELAPFVATLTQDGYTYTGTSHHQYESILTSEKFRNIDRTTLAVSGVKVSNTDTSTVTALENVDYYVFTNPESNTQQVMTVSQLVGHDGVTPLGDKVILISSSSEEEPDDKPGFWSSVWNWISNNKALTTAIAVAIIATMILVVVVCSGGVAALPAVAAIGVGQSGGALGISTGALDMALGGAMGAKVAADAALGSALILSGAVVGASGVAVVAIRTQTMTEEERLAEERAARLMQEAEEGAARLMQEAEEMDARIMQEAEERAARIMQEAHTRADAVSGNASTDLATIQTAADRNNEVCRNWRREMDPIAMRLRIRVREIVREQHKNSGNKTALHEEAEQIYAQLRLYESEVLKTEGDTRVWAHRLEVAKKAFEEAKQEADRIMQEAMDRAARKMQEGKKEADRIMQEAKEEADRIMQEAEERAARIMQEAKEEAKKK